jgi:FMN phosphatase YigB (HAD superfamily)
MVGDDPHSEIKAAQELGIEAVFYNKNNYEPAHTLVKKIVDFKELSVFF